MTIACTRRYRAMAFGLGVLITRAAFAQTGRGVITGTVLTRSIQDSAPPSGVRGAIVSLRSTRLVGTSDATGRFTIERVPAGATSLRVRRLGFRTIERDVQVTAGDTTRVDFILEAEAQLLSPIISDAPSADAQLFLSKPSVGVTMLGATAMAGVPSVGEPDVVRVVQLLPGVTARNDFSTGLNVRGGEADQNLVLLDGFPVYNPFHFGGVFSTFMDATVGGVELTSAVFPARYGGRLSSILEVQSAEETRSGMHTSADISVLGATGRVSGLFANERGSWSVSGRRTYADVATSLFTNHNFPYHFRDLQARLTYGWHNGVRLGITAYDGKDALDENFAAFDSDTTSTSASQGRWAFDWGNRVFGLTIGRNIGSNASIEQRINTSSFSTHLDLGQGASTQRNDVRDVTWAGSFGVHGASHDATLGYELASRRIDYAAGSSQTKTTQFDIAQRPLTAAAWFEDTWRMTPRWIVQAGVRGETMTTRQWAALSPRVSLKFFATPELALTAGAGRVTQMLQSLAGDGPLRYFDIWLASDSVIPVAAAWHYVAGVERRIRGAGSLRIEGYVKKYERLLQANWSEDPRRRGDEFLAATGLSYGVDALARFQTARGIQGWIAYSYGLSSRTRDGLTWAPGHDRRHDVNVVATWSVARYQLGARFGFATGTPYTPIVGEIARWTYDPSRERWNGGQTRVTVESIGGLRSSARFPATHRLDMDASREFSLRGATVTPYVSVVNAYNAKNVFIYLYDYSANPPTRRALSQFPIIPSAGVRIAF